MNTSAMTDLSEILADPETQGKFKLLRPVDQAAWAWRANWLTKAHKHQVVPPGDWWTIWLMLAGRGAGKTRTAAEQVGWWAWTEPGTRWLVGAPTSSDVRATCFEGDSGLLSVIPAQLITDYNRAFHELKLTNGSLIKGIPASEPERFRGPQFHGAWLDELAAWDYLQEAWDQIMFGVRLGKKTRILATTTPKPKDLIMDLVGREGDDVTVTRASTYENLANLAPSFQKQILQYEGTRLGRQEIYAEIIDPEESGIVKRDHFKLWPTGRDFPAFEYIIQSYDCASTEKTQNDPTACITFGVFKPTIIQCRSWSSTAGKTACNTLTYDLRWSRSTTRSLVRVKSASGWT
jgi:phage terminase large subunit-like protein